MRLTDVNKFLFCDLDGVLADFDKGVRKVTGKSADDMSLKELWSKIGDIIIEPNSSHHHILKILDSGKPLPKQYANHLKVFRFLSSRKMINKRMDLTDAGRAMLAGFEDGQNEEFIVDFYNRLDWMPDGHDLWKYISKHEPTILTGRPHGNWAEPQKRNWCRRELGFNVPVLVGLARHKTQMALEHLNTDNLNGSILIDDRPVEANVKAWTEAGGHWITHINTANTIVELEKMGL